MDVLAGADFFTVEVLTWRGLITYYILFFMEIGTRRVWLGGITRHPDSVWMEQVARNATMEHTGYLHGCRYLLHDRDQKFCREFGETLAVGGVKCTPLPARSPNLKRARGTLGAFDQRGVPVETDLVWRELVTACRIRVPGTLSPATKPSRYGQCVAVPSLCRARGCTGEGNPLSRAARRLA